MGRRCGSAIYRPDALVLFMHSRLQGWRFAVAEQELHRNDGDSRTTESARQPWSAPTLTVSSIEAVTQTATITNYDGTNVGS